MSMNLYGLREARAMIAEERKALAAEFPRSNDPYVRGQRDALKQLDEKIAERMKGYQPAPNPPASIRS